LSGRLAFFPTPYPDEVLYSVLCRYHVRSGNPGANTTRMEIWKNKHVAKSLYLPSSLDCIVDQLPQGSGLKEASLVRWHTMFPYIRPSLTPERADLVHSMLTGAEKECRSTYQKAGIVSRRPAVPQYLRYCPACVSADRAQFGEPYWHRLHQLPGVLFCPIHEEHILDSPVFIHTIFRYFFPLTGELCVGQLPTLELSNAAKTHHINFSRDSAWMLEEGHELGFSDNLYEKHLRLLEVKGYRGHSGATAICDYRKLNQDIKSYYGQDFLDSIGLYDEEDYTSWPATFARRTTKNAPTAQHLLMMRFLAGSPEQFFQSTERYLPFGEAPWPCHNRVCSFYLQDCIDQIDIRIKNGLYRAVFTCPHCGYSYLRGKATPKDQQYHSQVHLLDFGWLWRDKLRECLSERTLTVHQTVLEMGYPDTTIRKYGVEMGLLPESRMPWKTVKEQTRRNRAPFAAESRKSRRARWLQLVKDNPSLSRTALGRLDSENYKWLLANDFAWYEKHTPAAARGRIDWVTRDKEYLLRVQTAAANLQQLPGRPRWLCYSSIANQAGIGNRIYQMFDKVPMTKAYLDSVIETKDEWRMRKIVWAIQLLHSEGRVVSYDSVRHISGISTRVSRQMRKHIEVEIQCFYINISV